MRRACITDLSPDLHKPAFNEDFCGNQRRGFFHNNGCNSRKPHAIEVQCLWLVQQEDGLRGFSNAARLDCYLCGVTIENRHDQEVGPHHNMTTVIDAVSLHILANAQANSTILGHILADQFPCVLPLNCEVCLQVWTCSGH